MKYKYPKKILIGHQEYNMIYDKKEGGGEFSLGFENENPYIKIGMRDNGDFLNILLHELSEVIHCLLNTRFKSDDNRSNYHFCYFHKEFTTHTEILAGVLTQFIK